MNNLVARNTNFLAPLIYHLLSEQGVPEKSRNGPVLRLPGTTSVLLSRPLERVHFDLVRRCNPFFHVMEALAMIGNVNRASFLAFFAKNMLAFADEGEDSYNAFYGTRMHEKNQFFRVAALLRDDPDSRQAVVDLWRIDDLFKVTKDKACNLAMIFSVDQASGRLDLTTFNRSNDAIWGFATGANVVHFAFFLEYMAALVGRSPGVWHHTSANMHVYTENPQWTKLQERYAGVQRLERDHYCAFPKVTYQSLTEGFPKGKGAEFFAKDCELFCEACMRAIVNADFLKDVQEYVTDSVFLNTIAKPLFCSWFVYKRMGSEKVALDFLQDAPSNNDWIVAAKNWFFTKGGEA